MILPTIIAGLSALAIGNAAPAAIHRRDSGVNIIPSVAASTSGSTSPQLCLATVAAAADGTGLNFMDCTQTQTSDPNAANYGLWDISLGNQQGVKLTGTNFCLDAGLNPGAQTMVNAKIWSCLDVPQQQFYYTDDLHIAVTGYTPCLSLGRYGAQFAQCTANNNPSVGIQAFALTKPGGGSATPTTTSLMASTTSSTPTTTSTLFPNSPMGGRFINPNGDKTQCLTITSYSIYDGAPVGFAPCLGPSDPNVNYQLWSFGAPGITNIVSSYNNVCLDFGTGGGSNGTPMKVWTCYPGLFQQTLYYTEDLHVAVYNGNQCLDVQAGTSNVQSWQCSGTDPNQIFNVNTRQTLSS